MLIQTDENRVFPAFAPTMLGLSLVGARVRFMWRVYPSFLQLTFPPLLTEKLLTLAIQRAQKHVTTQTNDGNPPSPQRHTEGEGTHLVELSAHLLGLELLQEVPVLDGVQGHDLRAPPLPVIPDRRTPRKTNRVTPFHLDWGLLFHVLF